eukprot:TRINITY_DN14349_c0_g1_i1.p1 TRINITY_DN14349_c0_g1~~TRINITY_DN14349_c0_g1_i1.p1  ORF type:complete len:51 (-),score=2.95 TRINITY_DN14349_c0_g1_i1:91-243(-)
MSRLESVCTCKLLQKIKLRTQNGLNILRVAALNFATLLKSVLPFTEITQN